MLELDKQLFLLINGAHAPWLDPIMTFVTSAYTWIPFYVLLFVYLLMKKEYNLSNPFKKSSGLNNSCSHNNLNNAGTQSDFIIAGRLEDCSLYFGSNTAHISADRPDFRKHN
jgi:hypothetical protein